MQYEDVGLALAGQFGSNDSEPNCIVSEALKQLQG